MVTRMLDKAARIAAQPVDRTLMTTIDAGKVDECVENAKGQLVDRRRHLEGCVKEMSQ